jgi:hypothetical protein
MNNNKTLQNILNDLIDDVKSENVLCIAETLGQVGFKSRPCEGFKLIFENDSNMAIFIRKNGCEVYLGAWILFEVAY